MLLVKSIRKRKAKKTLGYIFISMGMFCVVLALCMGIFFLTQKKKNVLSPLATIGKIVFANGEKSQILFEVENSCHTYSLNCQAITMQDKSTISLLIDGHTIFLSTQKDLTHQMASLQLMISALTMEGKEFQSLDLRYDRPVISY